MPREPGHLPALVADAFDLAQQLNQAEFASLVMDDSLNRPWAGEALEPGPSRSREHEPAQARGAAGGASASYAMYRLGWAPLGYRPR